MRGVAAAACPGAGSATICAGGMWGQMWGQMCGRMWGRVWGGAVTCPEFASLIEFDESVRIESSTHTCTRGCGGGEGEGRWRARRRRGRHVCVSRRGGAERRRGAITSGASAKIFSRSRHPIGSNHCTLSRMTSSDDSCDSERISSAQLWIERRGVNGRRRGRAARSTRDARNARSQARTA